MQKAYAGTATRSTGWTPSAMVGMRANWSMLWNVTRYAQSKRHEQWGLQTPDIQVPRRIRRLPKAKTGTEAVAAALQVTTALGGAKKTPSPAKQAKKAKAIEKEKQRK